MIEIIPAIIPPNLQYIKEKLLLVLGASKKVQIDIADGKYAGSTTWPFNGNQFDQMIKILRDEERFPYINSFDIEIDLFTLHPIEYISDFISLGAKSFVIHIDSTDHVAECISAIKNSDLKVGIGIKPSINTEELYPYLPSIDFVQFMGNDRVGYGGVLLDEKVIKKISDFKKLHRSVMVQVDIGVNFETAPLLVDAGATRLVSGSTIFNSNDPREAITKLSSA